VVAGPGHGTTLAHQLREAWPNFAASSSASSCGHHLVNHHSLFKNFAKVDRTLLFLNLLLLLFVVTIPFVTSTLAKYLTTTPARQPGGGALQRRQPAMSVSFALLFNWSVRDPSRLRNPVPSEQLKRIRFRFVGVGTSVYVVALVVGSLGPRLSGGERTDRRVLLLRADPTAHEDHAGPRRGARGVISGPPMAAETSA